MTQGIIVEGLTKIYVNRKRTGWLSSIREEKVAIENLHLQLPPGQIIGLLGLNGAGKTTTLKILSTLLLPTSGSVQVDGLDLVRNAVAIRQRVNMIMGGERMVYWRLTGRENLWYFAQLYDIDKQHSQKRIKELLHLVGLEDAADIPVERYSKGMKQRLQIARGLINDPAYLFLDEPTLGLDAPIARELRQSIRQFAIQGKAALLTSHYLSEVEELCSQVYIIDRGQLVVTGSPVEIKTRTRVDRVVKILVSILPSSVKESLDDIMVQTGARLEVQHIEDGVQIIVRHPEDIVGKIVAAIALHDGSILKLEVLEPSLEDAVLALTASRAKVEDVLEETNRYATK